MASASERPDGTGDSAGPRKEMDGPEEKYRMIAADKTPRAEEAGGLEDMQIQDKLSGIREKIQSGYYDTDEVLESVASILAKTIRMV